MSAISSPLIAPAVFTLTNSKTLTASNTTASVPIFRVTGTVLFTKLYGIVTTAIGANHTAAYFRLNDQTAQIDITLNTGSTLSAFVAGSYLVKAGLAAAAVTVKNASAGAYTQSATAGIPINTEFVATKKSGANTDIEYTYSTTDTPTSGVILFVVEYQPLSSDGAVTAV